MVTQIIGISASQEQFLPQKTATASNLGPEERKKLSLQVLAQAKPVSQLAQNHGVSRFVDRLETGSRIMSILRVGRLGFKRKNNEGIDRFAHIALPEQFGYHWNSTRTKASSGTSDQ